MGKPVESRRIALHRKIVLRFPDFDGFATEYSANLSMTGMFIRSDDPQPPGTPVSFEFGLQDGAQLVRGKGWVVWSRERNDGQDRPAGMGVEFTELDRESRRLIRWLILNQLPEGTVVFDVNAGADAPTGVVASRARGGAVRKGLVVGAVLGAAVLAALWLRSAGNEEAGSAPAPAEAQQVASPALDPSGSAAIASMPVPSRIAGGSPAGAPGMGAPTDRVGARAVAVPAPAEEAGEPLAGSSVRLDVEGFVRSWAAAWSAQDVDAYLGHYSSAFVPESGESLAAWQRLRAQRLTAPSTIRVAVTRLSWQDVPNRGGDRVRVSFLQTYRSDSYSDTVDKVLDLHLEGGLWRIVREASS